MDLGYMAGCCAIQEIRHLNAHTTPLEAMKAFCTALWGPRQQYDWRSGKYVMKKASHKIDAHYIFSGVEGYSKPERYGGKTKYASAFAAFITENGLGEVIGTDPAINRMNHPTHKVAAWIWTPAPTKLKNWWKENK